MRQALAMVEYGTVSSGLRALDIVCKTAEINILTAQTVCPGKFMIIFCGTLSAVNASVEAAQKNSLQGEIDSFVLGNPHADILPALTGTTEIPKRDALGLVETYSGAAAIVAADTAAKTAMVALAEIRLSRGMCGKSTVLFFGDLAAVSAALEAAKKSAAANGMLLDTALIPNPDEKMFATLFSI